MSDITQIEDADTWPKFYPMCCDKDNMVGIKRYDSYGDMWGIVVAKVSVGELQVRLSELRKGVLI